MFVYTQSPHTAPHTIHSQYLTHPTQPSPPSSPHTLQNAPIPDHTGRGKASYRAAALQAIQTAVQGFACDHTSTVLPLLVAQVQQHSQVGVCGMCEECVNSIIE